MTFIGLHAYAQWLSVAVGFLNGSAINQNAPQPHPELRDQISIGRLRPPNLRQAGRRDPSPPTTTSETFELVYYSNVMRGGVRVFPLIEIPLQILSRLESYSLLHMIDNVDRNDQDSVSV
jgi:hypothetical protein